MEYLLLKISAQAQEYIQIQPEGCELLYLYLIFLIVVTTIRKVFDDLLNLLAYFGFYADIWLGFIHHTHIGENKYKKPSIHQRAT